MLLKVLKQPVKTHFFSDTLRTRIRFASGTKPVYKEMHKDKVDRTNMVGDNSDVEFPPLVA